jgi:hypothetical protein
MLLKNNVESHWNSRNIHIYIAKKYKTFQKKIKCHFLQLEIMTERYFYKKTETIETLAT